MDDMAQGKQLMCAVAAKLAELQASCSREVRFRIQNLLDLRHNHWQKKWLNEAPKTIADIHRDAEVKGSVATVTVQIAGQRPAYIDALWRAFKKEVAREPRRHKEGGR